MAIDPADLIEPADSGRRGPRRSAAQLTVAVRGGSRVGEALRFLDLYADQPGAERLAEVLAHFLVARCEASHPGWRVLRQVVVDSVADAPWERAARRAEPGLVQDLMTLSERGGRTLLVKAQHLAAERRAQEIAQYVDPAALLADLDLPPREVDADTWEQALMQAVSARSREAVARKLQAALDAEPGNGDEGSTTD